MEGLLIRIEGAGSRSAVSRGMALQQQPRKGGGSTVVPGGDKEPAKRSGVSSETVSSETEAVHQGGSFRGRALDKKSFTGVSNETVSSETEAARQGGSPRGRALDNLPCTSVSSETVPSETEAAQQGGSPRGRALDKKAKRIFRIAATVTLQTGIAARLIAYWE